MRTTFFLQILVETGIVGAFLFLLFILSTLIQSINTKSPLALSCFGMVIVIGMSENWKLSVLYMLTGVVLLSINRKPENQLEVSR